MKNLILSFKFQKKLILRRSGKELIPCSTDLSNIWSKEELARRIGLRIIGPRTPVQKKWSLEEMILKRIDPRKNLSPKDLVPRISDPRNY